MRSNTIEEKHAFKNQIPKEAQTILPRNYITSMKIEIDQSGKIENTNRDTIIAFSNHISGTILIKATDKKEIQRIFRTIGKPRIFIYKLFAILIYLLIKDYLKQIKEIVIDEEYPGKSSLIKDCLLREIKKTNPDFSKNDISFRSIGKKSKAHYLAYGVAIRKRTPDKIVNLKEVLNFLIK